MFILAMIFTGGATARENSLSQDGNREAEGLSVSPTSGISHEEENALKGDAEAASRMMLAAGKIENNRAAFLEWALIAAENGGARQEYTYAFFLINDNYAANRVRATFWLLRAESHGSSEASELLIKIRNEPTLNPVTGKQIIPTTNSDKVQIAALSGSQSSSNTLCRKKSHAKVTAGDRRYWCQIAAENGGAEAMAVYAQLLEASDSAVDRMRAQYWKRKIS